MDFIIVGLGNPGRRYQFTRHNIGFLCIDFISYKFKIPFTKENKKSQIGIGKIVEKEVLLMKPLTYMNLSGIAVLSALSKYRVKPENLIVIYDDIDLPLGKIRIRKKGSAGGHKGVQSIIFQLNNENFIRIRIGIGKPHENISTEDYVLSNFFEEEKKIIENSIKKSSKIVEFILKFNVDRAMNEFN